MRILVELYLNYGIKGVIIHILLKLQKTSRLKVPGVPHPIRLRPNTSDIPIFRQVFVYKEYDFNLEFEVKNIIDAGANIGTAAIYFANKYPKSKILCIEAEKGNFDVLKKNTQDYPNITSKHAAVWVSNEQISILDESTAECAFMVGKLTNSNQRVEGLTIDEIMRIANMDQIDILKLDVEGAEKEIFEGECNSWLSKTKCLVIELHDNLKPGTSKPVFAVISKYNFEFSAMGENLIFVNKDL